jgi:hypothetical protein
MRRHRVVKDNVQSEGSRETHRERQALRARSLCRDWKLRPPKKLSLAKGEMCVTSNLKVRS